MTESNRHIQAVPEETEPCPNCGAPLQRMPAAPGCMLGDDCTHGCPACGWHFAPEPDTVLVDTGSMFVRVPKEQP